MENRMLRLFWYGYFSLTYIWRSYFKMHQQIKDSHQNWWVFGHYFFEYSFYLSSFLISLYVHWYTRWYPTSVWHSHFSFHFFIFLFLRLVIAIHLSSNPLFLSSATLCLMLSPSSKIFISVIEFFKSTMYFFVF